MVTPPAPPQVPPPQIVVVMKVVLMLFLPLLLLLQLCTKGDKALRLETMRMEEVEISCLGKSGGVNPSHRTSRDTVTSRHSGIQR